MPDQYGRVTGRDWLGLTGAISNIDSMRRSQEYLGMQQAGEERKATLFEQDQENKAFNDSVDIEANDFIQNFENSGLTVGGVPTKELSGILSQNIEKGEVPARANIIASQKEKGRGALAHALGVNKGSKVLWENQEFQDQMTQSARKRGDQSYDDLKNGVSTIRDMIRRGNRADAAHLGAELITGSLSRLKGKVVDKNKINVIETVNGVDNIVNTLTPEEAVEFFGTYSKEKYTDQFVLDYKTGMDLNSTAIPIPIRTPDGKEAYYLKQYTGPRVDFYFYNKDGTPYENQPEDMSIALREGWMPEDKKAAEDLALVKAKREKIQKETGEIGKPKAGEAEKPMTADKAREKLLAIAKFKSSLNKTGGWNETIFELMAQKDPEFAKRALSINSSKKEVNDTIKELEDYYRSYLPTKQSKKKGKDAELDIEKQNAMDAIDQGIPLENVQRMYKLRTGEELEL